MNRRFALAPGIVLALAFLLWPRVVASSPTAAPLDSTPLGTAFTYQGELKVSGVPVNGACDLQFSLFDAASGGVQIGATQTASGVSVANGLFTVTLDFGAGAFNGDARWLQIAPACPPGSGFTPLAPRQALTATPYALFATGIPLLGNGTSTFAAHSDHNHYGATWTGSALLGLDVITLSTAPFTSALIGEQGGTGLSSFTNTPAGVRGDSQTGNGVIGVSDTLSGVQGLSVSGNGVEGLVQGLIGTGVYGHSTSPTAVGMAAGNSATGGTALEIRQGAIKVTGAGVGSSTPVFVHQATAANQCGIYAANDGTIISNPFADGSPTVLLMVTPVGGSSYARKPVAVAYNTGGGGLDPPCGVGHWLIYTIDGSSIVGTTYNVMVIRP